MSSADSLTKYSDKRPMRRSDHLLKTMTALRLCVEDCRRHTAPLAALEQHVEKLRQNPELTPADISQIEATARRALVACCPAARC